MNWKCILMLSCLAVFFCFATIALAENPPPNLPVKIKGNYRLIEHDAMGKHWVVYDFPKYSLTSDGYKMYPPIYSYDTYDNGKKWIKGRESKPMDNMYQPELVTIIGAKSAPKVKSSKKEGDGSQISGQEAVSKVKSSIKNPSYWSLASKPFKSPRGKVGFLVCGTNSVNTAAAGVWWCNGSKIYNVNGIAKGNTPKFPMTFDIGAPEGLRACKF